MRSFGILLLWPLMSCGVLVHVVDARGTPVQSARVAPVYPSINGLPSVTDADGYARLGSSWFFEALSVDVETPDGGRWHVRYPPPAVIRLGGMHGNAINVREPLPQPAAEVPLR